MVTARADQDRNCASICERLLPPTSPPTTCPPGLAPPRNCKSRATAATNAATARTASMMTRRLTITVKQRIRPVEGSQYREPVELRDLPSVDELARAADDPLAVDAARSLLARARAEIRAGVEPGDL